jgi:DNA repair ATPase RecN
MTTEERLSSAERHIAELQDQTSTMAQGQNAHGAILDRMGEVLERLAFAYVDTSNSLVRIEALVQDQVERLGLMEERLGLIEERLGLMEDRQGRMEERLERIEAIVQDHTRTLQAHSVDLSAIRAVLEQDQDEPDP